MKARLFIWGIVMTAIALLVYQNQEFYLSKQTLSLNLFTKIDVPPVANVTHALIYFLAGLLLACVSLYHERFKLRRQIKKLDTAFSSCAVQVAEIKSTEVAPTIQKTTKFIDRFRRKNNDSKPVLPGTMDIKTEP